MALNIAVFCSYSPRIREIQRYSLGPEASYPNKVFMVFLRTSRKIQDNPLKQAKVLSFQIRSYTPPLFYPSYLVAKSFLHLEQLH
jgi:hypothetical protein